jgi:hypothetical protein
MSTGAQSKDPPKPNEPEGGENLNARGIGREAAEKNQAVLRPTRVQ